jgi:predicted GNAT family acetyltransferase
MSPRVSDNPDRSRYEAFVDDRLAGFAEYKLRKDVIIFTHTEVDDAFEGQGVGSTLARGVLDAARDAGLRVRPHCPFIRGWIEKHPDYQDLVA